MNRIAQIARAAFIGEQYGVALFHAIFTAPLFVGFIVQALS